MKRLRRATASSVLSDKTPRNVCVWIECVACRWHRGSRACRSSQPNTLRSWPPMSFAFYKSYLISRTYKIQPMESVLARSGRQAATARPFAVTSPPVRYKVPSRLRPPGEAVRLSESERSSFISSNEEPTAVVHGAGEKARVRACVDGSAARSKERGRLPPPVRRNGSRAGSLDDVRRSRRFIAHPHASGGHDAARARTHPWRVRVCGPSPLWCRIRAPRRRSCLTCGLGSSSRRCLAFPYASSDEGTGRRGGTDWIARRPVGTLRNTSSRSISRRASCSCLRRIAVASAATPPASSSRAKPHRRSPGAVGRPAQTPIVRLSSMALVGSVVASLVL